MDFNLDEVQQLLVDGARRFVEQEFDFQKRREIIDSGATLLNSEWEKIISNGWVGASIPEEFGGLGGSMIESALVAQEFGRGLVLAPFHGCGILAPQTLLACSRSKIRDEMLRKIVEGSSTITLAYNEAPSYGMPDLCFSIAKRVSGGYILNGTKTSVIDAGTAEFFIVSALDFELEGESQIELFLIPENTTGVTRRLFPLHDGSWIGELSFKDVFVPANMLLTTRGEGMSALHSGIACGTATLCGELIGAMEKAIEITADYLRVRKQFGVTLSAFQALQHRMADMVTELEVSRSMLYALISMIVNDSTEAEALIVSQTKALVGRAAKMVCGQAIQLHGGIGMTNEYPVGHYFKRAVVVDLLLGSSDRHDEHCAASY